VLRPIVDDFLDQYPTISVRLILVARAVNLVEEGVDIALRLADLPDSSLIAVRVGAEVRRVVVASPRYLATHPRIREPADLAKHEIVAFTDLGLDSWTFSPAKGSSIPRTAQFTPRLTVNSIRAAVASAIARMAAEASALG
jgi:DNA-binding transcriptional LysR family regulator